MNIEVAAFTVSEKSSNIDPTAIPWSTLFVIEASVVIEVYLLNFFCSGIQCYVLSSPYLCFISLSYLDLYFLGDDAWIS